MAYLVALPTLARPRFLHLDPRGVAPKARCGGTHQGTVCMKRYGFALALISAMLLPLVASCVAPTPTPVPAPQPAEAPPTVLPKLREPVRLVFWHTEPEGSPAAQVLAAMIARFQEQHPWITIEPVYAGNYGDLRKKALAAIHAGSPPDLAVAYDTDIAEFMRAGGIAPLDQYAGDPEIGLAPQDRDDLFAGFWQSGLFPEFGNQVLSLPYAKSALALYYNLALLKAAGIEAPPRTWEEFEKACLATSKGDVVGYAYVESATTFDGWLYSRGASQLSSNQAEATFSGPEGVAALELLNRLLEKRAAAHADGQHGDRALFVAGKAAFTMDSTDALAACAEAIKKAPKPFEWGCSIIPQQDPDKAQTVLFGPNLCVFKTTEAKQQAAWRFIKWFNDAEQSAKWAAALGYAPLRRSAVQKLADTGWLAQNPAAKEACEAVIPRGLPEPNVRGEDTVRKAIENAWLAAQSGVKTPQQALDEAVTKANEALLAKP